MHPRVVSLLSAVNNQPQQHRKDKTYTKRLQCKVDVEVVEFNLSTKGGAVSLLVMYGRNAELVERG